MEAIYTIFAGVNGAGKSSLYQSMSKEMIPQERVNSDDILCEFHGDWKNPKDQAMAMKEAVKRIRHNFDNGISFNQETTLTGNSIINNIRRAKQLGYVVKMYYIGVKSADIAIKRVRLREQCGGHGIPETDIRRRYVQSLENLSKIIPMCDRIEIFDNTYQFKRVALFMDGKEVGINKRCKWLKNIVDPSHLIER